MRSECINMKLQLSSKNKHKGTDSGGHQRASVSVEASLVFPVFFFFIMLISRLFLLLMTELFVAEVVCRTPLDMAPFSYAERTLLKSEVKSPALLCYPEIILKISQNKQIENVSISCIDDKDDGVEVAVSYDFPVEAPGFPKFSIKVRQSFLIHTFIGEYDEDRLSEKTEEKEGDKVYITEGGQVYHLKRTCTYLFMPTEAVEESAISAKRNSEGAKYYPCERCKSSRNTGTVYITKYGNRYHLWSQCPALFRDVKEVDPESVKDRRPCSKCGKSEG